MVNGVVKLMTHSKHIIVVTEPITGYLDHIAIARSYGVLRPGVGNVSICQKKSVQSITTLQKQTAVGEIADAIPSIGTETNRGGCC